MNGEQWLSKRRQFSDKHTPAMTDALVPGSDAHELDLDYANSIGAEYFSMAANEARFVPALAPDPATPHKH